MRSFSKAHIGERSQNHKHFQTFINFFKTPCALLHGYQLAIVQILKAVGDQLIV
jgi:hypothetical protein